MGKRKICVYAIAKNEEQFVSRWVDSMKEADEIYVLDTGSTDHTVRELKKRGVHVKKKKIVPWRFDVARNESLKMVPRDVDICICTDLDEVFEKGWRNILEKNWSEKTTRVGYTYHWRLNEKNQPIVTFFIEKIHTRNDYIWTHPVHEVLSYIGKSQEQKIYIHDLILKHYPDLKKSRNSYLPLLELSVKECPEDDRNMHYLGREYMYYGKWNEAIDTLIRHLSLKTATWKDERSASMRFIARCYQQLKRWDEARMWLDKAIEETPYLRDPYMEKAFLEFRLKNWEEVKKLCEQALKITTHEKTYINEVFSWDSTVYDLLSISHFYLGNWEEAIKNCKQAIEMNPENERLQNNLKLMLAYQNK